LGNTELTDHIKARSHSNPHFATLVFLGFFVLLLATDGWAQAPTRSTSSNGTVSVPPEKALELAEKGHCKEALPALRRVLSSQAPVEQRKRAGGVGLRCALAMDDRDSTVEIARMLYKQFNDDPDILFMLVHAFSDLSTRAAQDLGRKAPQSLAAHKLNAEALEMQGKWDEAESEYETIIQKEPNAPGFHFLLGRLLLSRPDPDGKLSQRAKEEFQKEIEIDPNNAPAHYILGELAGRASNWGEAITHFTQATKLDPNFAEAYVGLGLALISVKRYDDAVPALRKAETLTPSNPSIHYGLATAFSRLGEQEEADKEFAIHRQLTETKPASERPTHQ
jgi:tetratricopeptide (TPR) repeat protein